VLTALVRPLWAALILGAVTSCAAHLPEALELEPSEEPSAALEPLAREPYASEDPAEPPAQLECLPEGFVAHPPSAPSHAAEPSSGACRSIPKSTRRQLSEQLRADWYYAYDDERLEIRFGCDRLGEIEEITVQYGSGHGGTLDLARLRPSADGRDWELLLLRHSSGYYPDVGERGAGAWRGRISAAELERALETSRAALVLDAEEPVIEGANYGLTSSSGDFHAFLRLVDAHGRARTVGFSGYPSSEDQLAWRIPELAVGPIAGLIVAAQLELAQPDADSRTFFMQRFVESEAAGYHGEHGAWWVHERLLDMAGAHATLDLVPALGLRLCPVRDGDQLLAPVGSHAPPALAAMLALLGVDEPLSLDERERLSSEQATRWIAACEVSCP
jgi:hypothetical protein